MTIDRSRRGAPATREARAAAGRSRRRSAEQLRRRAPTAEPASRRSSRTARGPGRAAPAPLARVRRSTPTRPTAPEARRPAGGRSEASAHGAQPAPPPRRRASASRRPPTASRGSDNSRRRDSPTPRRVSRMTLAPGAARVRGLAAAIPTARHAATSDPRASAPRKCVAACQATNDRARRRDKAPRGAE